MFECHGWVNIIEAFNEENESKKKLEDAVRAISDRIEKISDINLYAKLIIQNGCYNLLINGNFNRPGNRWEEILELFQLIGDVAEGSYGLLHFYDDETTEEHENTFQVCVLRRGKIESSVEKQLSPYLPTVEDIPD